ncbi:hypothetical protein [Acidaminobacter sp. JC074]|uniref:hypothetical protein n=1 Tax=Acidaminobacter sp. JC074 TaxID=2530199 RepID=UPI001F0F8E76|nr:hypothetical protein [Acidaminobacter sp. JC074]
MKSLLLSGLGTTFIGFVVLLPRYDDQLSLKASMAVSMISFMYSIFLMLLLLPDD